MEKEIYSLTMRGIKVLADASDSFFQGTFGKATAKPIDKNPSRATLPTYGNKRE
jgi:hypothetical protein